MVQRRVRRYLCPGSRARPCSACTSCARSPCASTQAHPEFHAQVPSTASFTRPDPPRGARFPADVAAAAPGASSAPLQTKRYVMVSTHVPGTAVTLLRRSSPVAPPSGLPASNARPLRRAVHAALVRTRVVTPMSSEQVTRVAPAMGATVRMLHFYNCCKHKQASGCYPKHERVVQRASQHGRFVECPVRSANCSPS